MIEKSFKTPFNFSPLQCTYLGENSFQYHLGLVRKNEHEKWLLRTSVQCIWIIAVIFYVMIVVMMEKYFILCE